MKKIKFLVPILFFVISCSNEEIDDIPPTIDISEGFPQNCDTVYVGETFTFIGVFSDNKELGSYSIDIHHNFDHHSHSTEYGECSFDEDKDAVNPFIFIQAYDIQSGNTEFSAEQEISVPQDVDAGDYHISLRLTDKDGWSDLTGLSIKILER